MAQSFSHCCKSFIIKEATLNRSQSSSKKCLLLESSLWISCSCNCVLVSSVLCVALFYVFFIIQKVHSIYLKHLLLSPRTKYIMRLYHHNNHALLEVQIFFSLHIHFLYDFRNL